MDNQNANPANDSDDMPPELPQRGGGTPAKKPAMDRIIHNFAQLKTDPKGWFNALPMWRKVCLAIFAVSLTVRVGAHVVKAFDGDPPEDIVKEAIEKQTGGAFETASYDIVNSYTRHIDDEDRRVVEYKAHMHIKPELEQYVGSHGGISYRSADEEISGTASFVKRGNAWYYWTN